LLNDEEGVLMALGSRVRSCLAWLALVLATPVLGQEPPPLPPDQPLASFWFPDELLAWSPAADPDAPFNRGATPLASRFLDPAQNVNAHARPNEARVAALVGFSPTSNNPSQGSSRFDYYALTYWPYIDVLVFFGGSASEGVILAPNPTVIDAAHRNGVPVLGNIFLPPTAFSGQIQWVRDLVQRSDSTFPVADKLIQVAEHYGFDGWFINQETAGGDAALAGEVREFMKYIQAHSSLRVMWYDAMVENGSISWQNALNASNDTFFQQNGRVSDDMFLNFAWSTSGLASSRSVAQGLGRGPYDLYAGADVQGNGYNTAVNWAGLFPEGQPHVVSLGFYRPEWTFKSAASHADFQQRDSRFWVGANGDPSNTTTTSAWKGVAHYVPARSPVSSVPFVTSFNTGQGHRYAINGQTRSVRDWNNLSLQDVLPTWRWIVQSTGTRLTPALDWTDAYYGGTSLVVSGNLGAPNDLKLYQTRLAVASDTNLRIAFKTGTGAAPTRMKVGLAFADSPASFQYLDVGATTSAGWNTRSFGLGQFAGRTIAVIGLRFESDTAVSGYSIKIGQIAVHNGPVGTPAPPTGLTVDRKTLIDASHVTLRLSWDHSSSAVRYYNVYRRNPDNSLTYLGGTPSNAYFVSEVARVGAETSAVIEVEAVGRDFGHSSHAATSFAWDGVGPANLALNKPATGSAPCNASEGPEKAVNGSVSGGNSDKWCSKVATRFLQVDLGGRFSLTRFVLKHASTGGESASLNTRDFNIRTSTDGTTFTPAVTVTGNTAGTTTHDIPATVARHVRLDVVIPTQTTNASARIYELEVYGSAAPAEPVTYEAESLTVAASSGDVHRVATDAGYSGGSGTILEANAAGDFVTYTVNVPEARAYEVRVRIKKLTNRGIWQLSSNGVNHGSPVDGFSSSSLFAEVVIGKVTFSSAGNKSFRFAVTGRNAASSGFWIALDYVKLIPQ
jgi:endo-beta-N-acetylglucosaminidase D